MKKADRQLIFDKYGGRCAYCGCELPKSWHVDHLEPIGRTERFNEVSRKWEKVVLRPENETLANYNPACPSCNIQKNSFPIESFRSLIEGFVNSLNEYHTQYKFAKRYGLVKETGVKVKFYFETLNEK